MRKHVSKAIVAFAIFIGCFPYLLHLLHRWNFAEFLLGAQMQFTVLSIAVFALSFFVRSKPAMIASSISLIANLVLIVPLFQPLPESDRKLGEPIKFLSLNVLHSNQQFDAVIQLVLDESPEIAVFQEMSEEWPAELAALQDSFAYHYRADEIEIEIFSNLPIENLCLDKIGEYRGSIEWDTTLNDQKFHVIAAHCYPQRYYGQQGFQWRNEQLAERIPRLVNRVDLPVVVLGDLNATPWSPYFSQMLRQTKLANARSGFGVFPSCGKPEYGTLFCVPYDHCLVSNHWKVDRFETGPFVGSDHLPIVVELRLELGSE